MTVIRARGLLASTCRFAGLVVLLCFGASYLAGNVGVALLGFVSVVVLAWEGLLLRAGLRVDSSGVRVRTPFGSEELPLERVESFRVTTQRESMDALDRAVVLAVVTTDGRERRCRWIAWQDFASAFMVGDSARPLSRSQTRALDRLNASLSAAKSSRRQTT